MIMQPDHSYAANDRLINIDGRTYNLYWCYQCHRTVRIASSDNPRIMCPRCFGQFVYEIDIARPRLVVEFTEFDPSPEARLLEALSLMLDPIPQTTRRRGRITDIGIQPPWRRGRVAPDPISPFDDTDGWGPESGILARPRSRSWVILTPNDLPRVRNNSDLNETDQPEGVIRPRRVDSRNYYDGSELNQLIEELTQNDRPGPLPAPDSAIDALPIVKITETHMLNDSQSCAVCMDDFKVGGEAKELPCNHIFHSNCIGPWLRLHNSCPVCRNELPVPTITTDGSSSDDGMESSFDGGGRRRRRCLRWRRLASVWPFNQSSTYRPASSHVDPNIRNREYSRVNSCSIL